MTTATKPRAPRNATAVKAQATADAQSAKVQAAEAAAEARKPSLTERRDRAVNDYRQATHGAENAYILRDNALVSFMRTLPESEEIDSKTKPVSERKRAEATLKALAVATDDKGKTLDIFELTPVRVVQIVKSYTRAEAILGDAAGERETPESIPAALLTDAAKPLISAINQAANGTTGLGQKGLDAVVSEMSVPEGTDPAEALSAAEATVRDAVAAKRENAPKPAAEPSVARPVVRVSNALDTLESILTDVGAELDANQKSALLARVTEISKHLS